MLKPIYRLSTVASVIALAAAVPAYAQDDAQLEVRAGATYASSPFLVGGGEAGTDGDAVALSIEALPELLWEDETSVVRLGGVVRYEEWLKRYGSDVSGAVSLSGQKRASETLSIFGAVGYQTSERPRPEALVSSLSDDPLVDPLQFEGPIDPTLNQTFDRRQSATASFGAEKRLSPTQSLRAEISGVSNWFEGDGLDYRTVVLDTSYSQQLNPRLSMIIGLSGAISDYEIGTRGDGVLGNATIGFDLKLSETGSLRASGGAGALRIDNGLGIKESKTFVVVDFNLCEQTGKSRICAGASRETRPTALGGATKVTAAQLGWDLTLGENESLSIGASYADTEASTSLVEPILLPRTKYAAAALRYSRLISENLGFYFAPSATKIFDDPLGRDANYQVSVGLSYIFGR